MTMQTLETLDYGDESFPDFLFFISLVFLNFFIDTSEEVSLISKLHYGAVGNKRINTREICFLNRRRPACSRQYVRCLSKRVF